MRSHVLYNLLQLVIILFMISKTSDACSCMPAHPQESFCNAEYVITAKLVDRSIIINDYGGPDTIVYKLNIEKRFKMTNKAKKYLKNRTINSSASDAMCGVDLQMNKTYAIAARGHRLKFCDFVMEYSVMTPGQKYGFAVAYKHGCGCYKPKQPGSCSFSRASWEEKAGVCIRCNNSTSKCHWRSTKIFKKCKKRERTRKNNAAENMALYS